MTITFVDFFEWLKYGVDRGWCTDIVCATHDGVPSTDEEEAEWENGFDPCQPVLRLWDRQESERRKP